MKKSELKSVPKNPADSNFCYYPFMQILLTSDGKYRPCSKHQDYITHNGKVLDTSNASLTDAWNADYMQDIRQSFHDNKRFEGCSECWRMHDIGLRSMRYDSFQYNTADIDLVNPTSPTRLEINASNVCNLKCRICYPNASNKWIKEYEEIYGKKEKVFYNLNLENINEIKNWASQLEELCFFGGEPLLSKENFELIDFLIEQDLAKNISLLFNTNGTIFNASIAEKLKYFKHVRMFFSIDDIGERFEYQRKGAKWGHVLKNIEQAYNLSLSEQGKNIEFKICTTVSIFNIYYFPEFFQFFESTFPGLKIFWNLLFDPWRLSVQILPKEVKKIIEDRLLNGIKTSYNRTEADTRTIDELIVFLNEPVDKPFDEFFTYVNRHDLYRKESFTSIFPEFYKLISAHVPEYIQWERTEEVNLHDAIEKCISEILYLASKNKPSNQNKIDQLFLTIRDHFMEYKAKSKFDFFDRYKRLFRESLLTETFFKTIATDTEAIDNKALFLIFKENLLKDIDLSKITTIDEKLLCSNLDFLCQIVSKNTYPKLFSDLLQTESKDLRIDLSRMNQNELHETLTNKYLVVAT